MDTRSVAPSTKITLYLVFAVLSNACYIRLVQGRDASAILCLLLASTATKILLLSLEQWPKTRILKLGREYSPEETSGVFTWVVFAWLLPLFQKGYRGLIRQEDLYPLDAPLNTAKLGQDMAASWEHCK
jgi:ATP-binding cassette, subfamily C (CFTR/MRP), member 1